MKSDKNIGQWLLTNQIISAIIYNITEGIFFAIINNTIEEIK